MENENITTNNHYQYTLSHRPNWPFDFVIYFGDPALPTDEHEVVAIVPAVKTHTKDESWLEMIDNRPETARQLQHLRYLVAAANHGQF